MTKSIRIATLKSIVKHPVTAKHKSHEDAYEYEVTGGGMEPTIVKFHSHPTKAWNWVILQGEISIARKVINAVCKVGFNREKMQTLAL